MFFKDRKDAGKKLAHLIKPFITAETLLVAIPNGGVIIAAEISRNLHLPLHMIVTSKVMLKGQPIGAVSQTEMYYLNLPQIDIFDLEDAEDALFHAKWEVAHRVWLYKPEALKDLIKAKTVVLVDDGIEYGVEIKTALQEIKKHHPKQIIVAVPVIPYSILKLLAKEVDYAPHLVLTDEYPVQKKTFYHHLPKVADEEVLKELTTLKQQPKEVSAYVR